MPSILIIEDETKVKDFMQQALQEFSYETRALATAEGALKIVDDYHPDLIILDAMLPGMSGFEFLAELRKNNDVPVIMVTALGLLKHKVHGLDSGADDYLAKPFKLEEMLARVRAQLRRRAMQSDELVCGDLCVNFRDRRVSVKGHRIFLSNTEYAILEELARNCNQAVTKSALLNRIWDDSERGENVVEVYVHYLRNKIEGVAKCKLIHTVRGKGYMLSNELSGIFEAPSL